MELLQIIRNLKFQLITERGKWGAVLEAAARRGLLSLNLISERVKYERK